jgi:cyclic nucleotide-binding protein
MVSMQSANSPHQNHLLAALEPLDRERIYPHLKLVPMPRGKVVYEAGEVLRHAYFPTDSIVSLMCITADGSSAQIAVIGNDGIVGVPLFMGSETTPSRAVIQSAGHAFRIVGQQLYPAVPIAKSYAAGPFTSVRQRTHCNVGEPASD